MKAIKIVTLLFSVFLVHAAFGDTVSDSATEVELWSKMYRIKLVELKEFSEIDPGNDQEAHTERDLAICAEIGDGVENLGQLFKATEDFRGEVFQSSNHADAEEIDQINTDVLDSYYLMKDFCFRSQPQYRNIQKLQNVLDLSFDLLIRLGKFTAKYKGP